MGRQGYAAAWQEDAGQERRWGHELGVLSLLRSCRLIYTEAVPLLYSTPTFSFSHTGPLTFLASTATILPHRRNAIRNINLSYLDCQRLGDGDEEAEFSYVFIRNLIKYIELPDSQEREMKLTERWAV